MEESVTKEWKNWMPSDDCRETRTPRHPLQNRGGETHHHRTQKYDRTVEAEELSKQVRKYQTALRKCLAKVYPDEPDPSIETICILGSPPEPAGRIR